jgi:hypothetical protein
MGLREIGWGGMHWINLPQDRDQRQAVMNMVMNIQVQLNVWKLLSS